MKGDVIEIAGKKYVSTKKASSLTCYSHDYVGQLCRQKKVTAERVGGAWFVEEQSILDYEKAEKYQALKKSFAPKTVVSEEKIAEKPLQKELVLVPSPQTEVLPVEEIKDVPSPSTASSERQAIDFADLGKRTAIYAGRAFHKFGGFWKKISVGLVEQTGFMKMFSVPAVPKWSSVVLVSGLIVVSSVFIFSSSASFGARASFVNAFKNGGVKIADSFWFLDKITNDSFNANVSGINNLFVSAGKGFLFTSRTFFLSMQGVRWSSISLNQIAREFKSTESFAYAKSEVNKKTESGNKNYFAGKIISDASELLTGTYFGVGKIIVGVTESGALLAKNIYSYIGSGIVTLSCGLADSITQNIYSLKNGMDNESRIIGSGMTAFVKFGGHSLDQVAFFSSDVRKTVDITDISWQLESKRGLMAVRQGVKRAIADFHISANALDLHSTAVVRGFTFLTNVAFGGFKFGTDSLAFSFNRAVNQTLGAFNNSTNNVFAVVGGSANFLLNDGTGIVARLGSGGGRDFGDQKPKTETANSAFKYFDSGEISAAVIDGFNGFVKNSSGIVYRTLAYFLTPKQQIIVVTGQSDSKPDVVAQISADDKKEKPASSGEEGSRQAIIVTNPTQIIERTTLREISGISESFVDQKLSELELKLRSAMAGLQVQTSGNATYINNVYNAVAQTNRIDVLNSVDITDSTFTGGSISGVSFSGGNGSFSGTLSVGGNTTLSGDLSVSGLLSVTSLATSTFAGDVVFDSDTLYIDSVNGRVGVGTTSPSDTFALNGAAYFAPISTPAITVDRLYNNSGDLYWAGNLIGGATTGNWATDGTNAWRAGGNVGVGTSSPYSRLAVEHLSTTGTVIAADTLSGFTGNLLDLKVASTSKFTIDYQGNVTSATLSSASFATNMLLTSNVAGSLVSSSTPTAAAYLATSTTATSTFAGGLSVAGSSGLSVLQNGKVGVGTALPAGPFQVNIPGLCVTGDTKLRRRRKAKKGEKVDADGFVYDEPQIKDIKAGDEIQTLDTKTGKLVWSRVKQLAYMGVKPIFKLTTQSGKTIRTTGNHPYFVREKNSDIPKEKPTLGVFYDNSNLFYAQKKAGWKLSLGALHEELSVAFNVKFLKFYTAIPREGDDSRENTLKYLDSVKSFVSLVTKPLKYIKARKVLDGKIVDLVEKKGDMDVDIALDVTKTIDDVDALLIVSGDSDLLPLKNYSVAKNKKIAFAGFENNMAWELRQILHIYLDSHKNALSLTEETDTGDKKQAPSTRLGVALLRLLYTRRPSLSSGGKWTKVMELINGQEVAITKGNNSVWDTITNIESMPSEDVYDIEVEGTHNFIGNGIVAHNTAFLVDSSGQIGIGTTSPFAKLSVNGSVAGTSAVFAVGTSTAGFATSTAFIIDSSGKVGIGTTTPSADFAVQGSTLLSGTLSVGSLAGVTSCVSVGADGILTRAGSDCSIGFSTTSADYWGAKGEWIAGKFTATSTATSTFYGIEAATLVGAPYFNATSTTATSTFSGGLSVAGTSGLTVLQNGKVGVGLVTAPKKLTVNVGSTDTNGIYITETSDQSDPQGFLLQSDLSLSGANNKFHISSVGYAGTLANPNEIMTLTGGSNVGVGTTTPGFTLGVTGTNAGFYLGSANILMDNTSGVIARLQGSGDFIVRSQGGNLNLQSSGGMVNVPGTLDATLYTSASFTTAGGLGVSKSLLVSGNVGIGTTSPSAKLSINQSSTGVGFYLAGYSNNTSALFRVSTSTLTATTTAFLIDSNGKVGIGTTSPSQQLSVQGNILASNIIVSGLSGATSCVSVGADGILTRAGADCGVGGTGFSTTSADYWGAKGEWIAGKFTATSTATSTFYGIEAATLVGAPYFNATSTTATSTFSGGLSVAGTSGLTVLQNGNVGVGTIKPYSSLYVSSSANNIAVLLNSNAGVVGNTSKLMLAPSSGFNSSTYSSLAPAIGGVLEATGSNNSGLAFYTYYAGGQQEDIRISASGNVGIGTTTPTSLLQIANATAPKLTISDTDASANQKHWFIESNTGKFAIGTTSDALATNATYRALTIDSSGRVGIGTASPEVKLDIVSDNGIRLTALDASNIQWGYSSLRNFQFLTSSSNNYTTSFSNDSTGVHNVNIEGSVGIGTTSPSAKLSINQASTGVGFYLAGYSNNTSALFRVSTSTLLATSTAFIIDSNGKVGIGTSTPGTDLAVQGVASAQSFQAYGTTATSTFAGGLIVDTNSLVVDYSSGRVGIGTASPSTNLNINSGAAQGNIVMSVEGTDTSTDLIAGTPLGIKILNRSIGVYGTSLDFSGYSSNSTERVFARIAEKTLLETNGTESGALLFATINSGTLGERMRIDSNGNVGIGTTSPAGKLDIRPDSSWLTTSAFIFKHTSNDPELRMYRPTGDGTNSISSMLRTTIVSGAPRLDILTGNSATIGSETMGERVSILHNGNVGIGTTSPLAKLDVTDGFIYLSDADVNHGITDQLPTNVFGKFAPFSTTAGGLFITGVSDTDATAMSLRSYVGSTDPTDTTPAIQLYAAKKNTTNHQALGNLETVLNVNNRDTILMTILGGGNVGIGTTSPSAKLSINQASTGVGFYLAGYSNNTSALFTISTSTASATSTAFIIDSNGKLGVGTTTPSQELSVAGNILTSGTLSVGSLAGATSCVQVGTDGILTRSGAECGTTSDVTFSTTSADYWGAKGTWIAGAFVATSTATSTFYGIEAATLVGAPYFNATSSTATSTFAGGLIVDTNSLVVDYSSGKVGVGTTNPLYKLHVYGSRAYLQSNNQYVLQLAQTSSAAGPILGTDNSADFVVYTSAGGELFRSVAASGNVGIGSSTPSAKLSINQASTGVGFYLAGYSNNTSALFRVSTSTLLATSTAFMIDSNGKVGIGTSTPGTDLAVHGVASAQSFQSYGTTATSTFAGGLIVDTNSLVVDYSSGRVGIGTAAPAYSLDVAPDTAAGMRVGRAALGDWGSFGGTNDYAVFGHVDKITDATGYALLQFNAGQTYLNSKNAGISFRISNSEKMILDTTGNVGIGTTTPNTNLTISSSQANGVNISYDTSAPTNSGRLFFTNNSSSFAQLNQAGVFSLRYGATPGSSSGTAGLVMDSTGNVGIGTTSPSAKLSINQSSTGVGFYLAGYSNNTSALFRVSTSTLLATSTAFMIDSNGKVGIGTTTPSHELSVAGNALIGVGGNSVLNWNVGTINLLNRATTTIPDNTPGSWSIATSSTALSSIFSITTVSGQKATSTFTGGFVIDDGAFSYDHYSGEVNIDNLVYGGLNFDSDAGVVQWIDLPVSSTPAAGTAEAYMAKVGGTPVLTVYGEADGGGGVNTLSVGIGTTSPFATLSIQATTSQVGFNLTGGPGSTFDLLRVASSSSAYATSTAFIIDSNGKVGIGTTSPQATLGLEGSIGVNSSQLYLAANGNVGVGTAAPGSLLHLKKDLAQTVLTGTNKGILHLQGTDTASDNVIPITFGGDFDGTNPVAVIGAQATVSGSKLYFGTSNSYGSGITNTAMTISYNGLVGIGTTSPYSMLSISNSRTTAANTPLFTLASTTDGTATTTAFTVLANGNVGIGTGVPSAALTIDRPSGSSSFSILNNGSASVGAVSFVSQTNGGSMIINDSSGSNFINLNARQTGDSYVALTSRNFGIGITSPTALLHVSTSTPLSDVFRVTAGSNNLVFDENGNFGIGSTTPFSKLSVDGDTWLNSNVIRFASSSAPSLTVQYLKAATSTIIDNTNYAWTLATSTTASPIFSITTVSGQKATSTFTGGFSIDGGAFEYDHSSGIVSADSFSMGNFMFDSDAGTVTFVDMPVSSASTAGTAESYSSNINGNSILTVYATADGVGGIRNDLAVGIGTTTPLAMLDVFAGSTTPFTTGKTADYNAFNISNQATSSTASLTKTGINIQSTGSWSGALSKNIGLYVSAISGGSSNYDAIFGGGNAVGIGTTSPWAMLSVAATSTNSLSNMPLFVISTSTASATSTAFIVDLNGLVGIGTTTPSAVLSVQGQSNLHGRVYMTNLTTSGVNQTYDICMDDAGQLIADTVAAGCVTSSAKFKHDIRDFDTSGLDTVLKLRPVSFFYNQLASTTATSTEQLGFIAEEAELIDPRLVGLGSDGKARTFKYENFTAVLAKAIQELDAKVKILESIASSTPTTVSVSNDGVISTVSTWLESLGVRLSATVSKFTNILTGDLTVGSADKPTGVTLYSPSGKPFCLSVDDNGISTSTPGACGASPTSSDPNSSPVIPDSSSTSDPNSSPEIPDSSSTSDTTPPVITLLGNNPAEITVGTSYNDVGATATDDSGADILPDLYSNNVDTTTAGTYEVVWTAHDGAMNFSTSTRTVIVRPVGGGEETPPDSTATEDTDPNPIIEPVSTSTDSTEETASTTPEQ